MMPYRTLVSIAALAIAVPALAQSRPTVGARSRPVVTTQPPVSDPEVARWAASAGSAAIPSPQEMTRLLRKRIKYVFVLFNENESFDHEYGSFPGADGLYSDGRSPRAATATPGFVQSYVDEKGTRVTVRPFRLGPAENATVMDSVDHSHEGLAAKLHVVDGRPRMDGFAQVEFTGKAGPVVSAKQAARGRQYANLVMSHIDCDTIPFFWRYASRFALFDNIFATEDTPSTPNAIAMIAGQSGESQWVKHGAPGTSAAMRGTINGHAFAGTGTTQGIPVVDDPNPYWGSQFDPNQPDARQPVSPKERYGGKGDGPQNIAPNLGFATVPLIAMGSGIRDTLSADRHPAENQADIARDIPAIAAGGLPPVAWRWYQNGYDHEPTDPVGGPATHGNFVAHHEGPQYFGYIADNDRVSSSLRGEDDFFADLAGHKLPAEGGIVYIRGGFNNIQDLQVPIQNPGFPAALTGDDIRTIRTAKNGDDDHPGYADRQISEAMNARVINAIARDPELWAQSAIIVTYDESDGFYDHVPPRILSYGHDHLPLSRGVRVPLLLISAYARAHAVVHVEGDHNAVIETIERIFGLPALASLPDEKAALAAGDSPAFNRFGPPGFHQKYLGPRDINSPITDSLVAGFDPARLAGTAPILPGSYADIPDEVVRTLPHYGGQGCRAVGIVPEDVRQGVAAGPPPGFNTLPSTLPRYNGAP